jgi:hypothetical protein
MLKIFEKNFSSWTPCPNNIEPNCHIELIIAPIQFFPLSKFFLQLNLAPQSTIYVATPLLEECENDTHTPEMGTWESSETLEISELDCRGQNTSP